MLCTNFDIFWTSGAFTLYNLALIIRLKESALKHHVKGHWEPAFPHWGMIHCAPQNRFWGLIMSICCGSVQRPNESSYVNKD